MFRRDAHWAISDSGFAVRHIGRTGIEYSEHGHTAMLNSELLVDNGVAAFFDTPIRFDDGSEPCSPSEFRRIWSNALAGLEFLGFRVDVGLEGDPRAPAAWPREVTPLDRLRDAGVQLVAGEIRGNGYRLVFLDDGSVSYFEGERELRMTQFRVRGPGELEQDNSLRLIWRDGTAASHEELVRAVGRVIRAMMLVPPDAARDVFPGKWAAFGLPRADT
jgi:hypothetical protein